MRHGMQQETRHAAGASGRRDRVHRLALQPVLLLATLVVLFLVAASATTPPAVSTTGSASASLQTALATRTSLTAPYSAGVEKGIWDDSWVTAAAATRERILDEIADADQLDASVVRLTVFWSELEPLEGVYNQSELAVLSSAVDAARAHGLRVILTFYGVPEWASDSTFWVTPPQSTFPKGTYYNFYIPKQSAMSAYGVFVDHVTKLFAGRIFAWECWNEPNIWWFWYPQQTKTNKYYGVDRYLDMLKRFAKIVRRNDAGALVLGGNTASLGYDNVATTSPLTWAKRLKAKGAASYFDAYSHHPYAIGVAGAKKQPSPEQAPPAGYAGDIVTLGNIQTLLKIFPSTDFYLTEYGYNTKVTSLFGRGKVTEAQQAEYLRRAYRLCAKYPQIRLLTWYLRKDVTAGLEPWEPPMYSGLRRVNNSKKPAWWAYARHNKLTIVLPASARRNANTVLTGKLTHAGTGIAARVLTVQKWVGSAWTRFTTCRTRGDGSYKLVVRLAATTRLRVVWDGVVESPSRTVRVH